MKHLEPIVIVVFAVAALVLGALILAQWVVR
jgi:hypothetical protein